MIRKTMADGIDVKAGLKIILDKLETSFAARSEKILNQKPFLVAVSKTKPVEAIIEAYSAGQRHFGENYANELADKGTHQLIKDQCPDIKWHFIGHLQRNNINKIMLPSLYMVETVDSEKLATALDKAWKTKVGTDDKLRVLVQVNTSREENKSGVDPAEVTNLYKFIVEQCPNLTVEGVMTIGRFGHDYSTGPNPDFEELIKCHANVCQSFSLNAEDVHMSMGMSDDFQEAISSGSTIIRVGSAIFGHRVRKE